MSEVRALYPMDSRRVYPALGPGKWMIYILIHDNIIYKLCSPSSKLSHTFINMLRKHVKKNLAFLAELSARGMWAQPRRLRNAFIYFIFIKNELMNVRVYYE